MEKDQKRKIEIHIPRPIANTITAAMNGLANFTGIEEVHCYWDNGIQAGYTQNGVTHTKEWKRKS